MDEVWKGPDNQIILKVKDRYVPVNGPPGGEDLDAPPAGFELIHSNLGAPTLDVAPGQVWMHRRGWYVDLIVAKNHEAIGGRRWHTLRLHDSFNARREGKTYKESDAFFAAYYTRLT